VTRSAASVRETGDRLHHGDEGGVPRRPVRTRDISRSPRPVLLRPHARPHGADLRRTDDMLIIRGGQRLSRPRSSRADRREGREPHYQLIVTPRGVRWTSSKSQVEVNESIFTDEVKGLEGLARRVDTTSRTCPAFLQGQARGAQDDPAQRGEAKRVIDREDLILHAADAGFGGSAADGHLRKETRKKVEQIFDILENKSGRLAEVTECWRRRGQHRAFSADTADFGILRLIVEPHDRAKLILKESGFTVAKNEVVALRGAGLPRGAGEHPLDARQAGINVEYMYAFVQRSGRTRSSFSVSTNWTRRPGPSGCGGPGASGGGSLRPLIPGRVLERRSGPRRRAAGYSFT